MSYGTIWQGEVGNDFYRINADYGMPSFIVEHRSSRGWHRVLNNEIFNFILTRFYLTNPHFKEIFALLSGKEEWYDDWM